MLRGHSGVLVEHSVVKSKKRDVWNGAVCYGRDRHRNTHKSTQTHTHNNHTAQVTKRDLGTTRMDVDLVVDDVVGRVDTMARVLRKRRRK